MQQIMTAQEIYANFHDGEGPEGLARAGMHLQIVQAKYGEREQQIKELSASMEECWTGDASGAAQRGAGPLAVEHAGAAEQMTTAASLLTDQSTAWIDTKNKVQPVPPVPEEPSTLKQIITMGSANSDYENQVRASHAAAQANVDAMSGWTSTSSHNGTTMPSTYGQIDPGALNISMAQPGKPPSVQGFDGGTGGPGGPGGSGGRVGGTGTGAPGTTGRPNPVGDKPGPDESTRPDAWTPIAKPGFRPGQQGGLPPADGLPTPREFGGIEGPGSIGDRLRGGPGGTGGGTGSGPGGRTGGFEPGVGAGAGSGDKSLGGGRGSGAGTPAVPGTPGAPATRGAGAGRPGAPGMGGMGTGGGKGQGAEDEEHQRKYVLDGDEHFQPSDDGGPIVDPRTGMKPVPPVIGEK